nr:heterokaryon incompatibility protein 6, or allele [Quercus suber]
MVSISPRLRDDLQYDALEDSSDPRLSFGFRSLSINSEGYEDHEPRNEFRAFAGSPDPGALRRRRKQRLSDQELNDTPPYMYHTVADGHAFRLVVLLPGTGDALIKCQMLWESSNCPSRQYKCLSYSWGTNVRNAAILCDGYRFPVTENLLVALRSLRRPKTNLLIWDDLQERSQQVDIMKNIFSQAKEVIVWLGEADDRSEKLFEYARKLRRGEENLSKASLQRILTQRQLQDALQKLLTRPWNRFTRVWVVPEVALAKFTTVACGKSMISWDNLVRLIRDIQLPQMIGFDKQTDLLGNPYQRIAIITQMIQSQKEKLHHTDIMQLLILAKGSKATDLRDMIYAFYGVTLLRTYPDYTREIEQLYAFVAHQYVTNILDYDSYGKGHDLSEEQKTQQLMSVLYSAGALHQHYALSSWIPDWTAAWHLAPIWCKTTSNIVTGSAKDAWSSGVRTDYRAGGSERGTFEVIDSTHGKHRLRLSVRIFDRITVVSETTPASTPSIGGAKPPTPDSTLDISPTLRYGRTFFNTVQGRSGIATPGVVSGDVLALIVGGDVPIALRRCINEESDGDKKYLLLCEVYVHSDEIMHGDMMAQEWTTAEDIVLL